jgi:hypothetical protein
MSHSSPFVPSFLVDSGVESWGTKPSWLTVTGDPYLVGVKNLNVMIFTHNAGEVTCVIDAIADGNLDTDKPVFETLFDLQFNENQTVSVNNVLSNQSDWASITDASASILPATNATYTDLGDGNYSLVSNTSNNNTTGGIPILNVGSHVNRLLSSGKVTFIWKWRRLSPANTSTIWAVAFANTSNNDGIRVEINQAENRLKFRASGTIFAPGITNSIVFEQDKWIETAITYDAPNNDLKQFARSTDYTTPIAFGQKSTGQDVTGNRPITSTSSVIRLNNEVSATDAAKRNNYEQDYFIMVADELPASLIEAIMNNPQNLKSLLKTHYSY